jgi:type III pantothenate kinase
MSPGTTAERIGLAIDIGNTATKFGLFDPVSDPDLRRPCNRFSTSSREPDFDELDRWLPPSVAAACCIQVSRRAAECFQQWLARHRPAIVLDELTNDRFSMALEVHHPEQVGVDRVAAAWAARQLGSSTRAAIVVDAGSAITVDLISAQGEFMGGAIMPGWSLMARALAQGTDRLPDLSDWQLGILPSVVGKSTELAIRSGVVWGTVGAVREIAARLADTLDHLPARYLTGGLGTTLLEALGPEWQFEPDLVLSGVIRAGWLST